MFGVTAGACKLTSDIRIDYNFSHQYLKITNDDMQLR